MLRWKLQYGSQEQHLERLYAKGKSIPILESRPVLRAGEEQAWRLYCCLDHTRSRHKGIPKPLQLIEIKAAFDLFGIHSQDHREHLLTILLEVDAGYLAYKNEQHTQSEELGSGNSQADNRRERSRGRR